LEAKNFKIADNNNEKNQEIPENSNKFERRWKDKKVLEILEKLSVQLPDVEDVLQNPLNYIETEKTDILIPAKASQKVGWGTGFTIVDTRLLLQQIIGYLPSDVTLTKPWKKISTIKDNDVIKKQVKDADQSIKNKFIKHPVIKKPSKNQLRELPEELKDFLKQRANNRTLHICTRTPEVKIAIEEVANHYFGDSLKLNFIPSQGLADPIQYTNSKKPNYKNNKKPNIKHIKEFRRYSIDSNYIEYCN
jgi:hypothetical protein